MNIQAMDIIKKYGIYLALIILMVFFSVVTNSFLKPDNLFNVARQISMLGIAAVGMAFVLLLGGIDLSIGSQITLVNIVAAWLMVKAGVHPLPACIVSLAMSSAVGFINGWIIANIKMPPLIVTLASMTMLEGLAFIICNGIPIFGFPKGFSVIGQGYLGPVPIPVIIMAAILATGAFILNETFFGRWFYAVGGNEMSARVSGINVAAVKVSVYAVSGLLAGVAGLLLASRIVSGNPNSGSGYELDAIAAVTIGGVSMSGGAGGWHGAVVGTLFIAVMGNGLDLLGMPSNLQLIIKGAIIIAAVFYDKRTRG